jgi:hypothetical protein
MNIVVRKIPAVRAVLHAVVILVLLSVQDAHAVQVHGPPEGLYVHQMAHIAFALSMIFLLYMLNRRPLGDCAGWKYLKFSIFLFLLWNIDTLVVHYLGIRLPGNAIQGGSLFSHTLTGPDAWQLILFYILRNDHFLCVPAMAFMLMFLRTFYMEHLNAQCERDVDKRSSAGGNTEC